MTRSCALKACNHNSGAGTLHPCEFVRFPVDDKDTVCQWIRVTGKPDLVKKSRTNLKKYFVCHCHFIDDDFILNEEGERIGVKPSVCPSQNLGNVKYFVSDEDLKSVLTDLPKFEMIRTSERVPPNVFNNPNSVVQKSTLKRKSSIKPRNTTVAKKKKTVNDATTEVETLPAHVDFNDPSFHVPEPVISMETEASTSSATKDLNREVLSVTRSSISTTNNNNESTPVLAKNSAPDATVEIQPTPCNSNTTTRTLKRDISTISSATVAGGKRRKQSNLGRYLEILDKQDEMERQDNGTLPNSTTLTVDKGQTNNNQLEPINSIEASISSDVSEPTQSVNRYSSSATTRLQKKSDIQSMLLRGAINQLTIVLRLKPIRSHLALASQEDCSVTPENQVVELAMEKSAQSAIPTNHPTTPVTSKSTRSVKRPRIAIKDPSFQRNTVQRITTSIGAPVTPNKKILAQKILRLERKITEMENKLNDKNEEIKNIKAGHEKCSCNITSPLLSRLNAAHLRNKDLTDKHNRIWTPEDKLFALHIYRSGAKAYCALHQEEPTCFPSPRTILRLSQMIPFTVGINPSYFKALGEAASKLSPKDKLCCLSFDEVGTSALLVYDAHADRIYGFEDYGDDDDEYNKDVIANKALVVMAQGLGRRWKQPLAVFFNHGGADGEKIAELIKLMIDELFKIDIIVKAVVADQASANCRAMEILRGIADETANKKELKKTVTFFVRNGVKTITLADAPHLWKRLKENFVGSWKTWKKTYESKLSKFNYPGNKIVVDELVGDYRDIVLLHQMSEFNKHAVLSDAIVFPDAYDAMCVLNACKLFSKTTGKHLRGPQFEQKQRSRVDWRNLLEDKKAVKINDEKYTRDKEINTAKLVELLNDLCDVTNGPSSKEKVHPNAARCNVTVDSYHHKKWAEFIELMEKTFYIKWQGGTSTPPTIDNIILTIRAMRDLWQDLYENYGIEELNLRQLHQDVLESLFADLRYAGGANDNPTVIGLLRSLKCLIISRFSCPVSSGANCERDDSPYLLQQQDWLNCSNEMRKKKDSTAAKNVSQDTVNSSITSSDNNSNIFNSNNSNTSNDANASNDLNTSNTTNDNNSNITNDYNCNLSTSNDFNTSNTTNDNNSNITNDYNSNDNDTNDDNILHLPDYDSGNEEIIGLLHLMADAMPSIVTSELMRNLNLDSECNDCQSCFIHSSANNNNSLFEPTQPVTNFIITAEQIFRGEIVEKQKLKTHGIAQLTSTLIYAGIKNVDWINCESHGEKIRKEIGIVMARILIRRQVAILNMKRKCQIQKSKNAAKIAKLAIPKDIKK